MHHLVGEFLLDDHIGFLETFLDVALGELDMGGNIALLVGTLAKVGGGQVFMQKRGVIDHGLANVHHRRQDFVFHFDQVKSSFGNVLVHRRHGCDGVALVESLAAGQQVVAGHLGAAGGVRLVCAGHVLAGYHGFDARHGQRLAHVNRLDAGVGMGAAQHLAVQHSGGLIVTTVFGPPGHLVGAVGADGTGTHHVIFSVGKDDVLCHRVYLTRKFAPGWNWKNCTTADRFYERMADE